MRNVSDGVGLGARGPEDIRPAGQAGAVSAEGPHALAGKVHSSADVDWTAIDWDDLVPRLLLLSMSRLARMTWRGQRGSAPPGAAEAEDFVNDAIAKTMDGVRVWREEACSLYQHLAGIIVSDISHAATAAENRLTLSDDGRDGAPGGWPPDRADEAPDQEQTALWRSEQRQLLDHLHAIDDRLGRMAELILMEDIDQTRDLALRLDLTAMEVANLRKRLKRVTKRYLLADEARDLEAPA